MPINFSKENIIKKDMIMTERNNDYNNGQAPTIRFSIPGVWDNFPPVTRWTIEQFHGAFTHIENLLANSSIDQDFLRRVENIITAAREIQTIENFETHNFFGHV